jgi:hypothetical protein
MKHATITLSLPWSAASTPVTVVARSAHLARAFADIIRSYAARRGVGASAVEYAVSYA